MASNRELSSEYDYLFKFYLVGDSGVGKSCLLLRYADDTYTDSYISTIGVNFKIADLNIDGKIVKTQVWDCAPTGKFRTITENHYRGTHALIVAFDLTNPESFKNVRGWLEEYGGKWEANIILVGTKSDDVKNRAVSEKEINDFKDFMKECGYVIDAYIATSAKTGKDVHLAFETAVKCVMKRVAPKMTLEEFKKAYTKQYKSEFFKNPLGGMKEKLDTLSSIDDVEKYAKDHPNSRTAKVLKQFKK